MSLSTAAVTEYLENSRVLSDEVAWSAIKETLYIPENYLYNVAEDGLCHSMTKTVRDK